MRVFPAPVGAVNTIDLPLPIDLIASNWKSSSGNGKITSRFCNKSVVDVNELTSWYMIYLDINKFINYLANFTHKSRFLLRHLWAKNGPSHKNSYK